MRVVGLRMVILCVVWGRGTRTVTRDMSDGVEGYGFPRTIVPTGPSLELCVHQDADSAKINVKCSHTVIIINCIKVLSGSYSTCWSVNTWPS